MAPGLRCDGGISALNIENVRVCLNCVYTTLIVPITNVLMGEGVVPPDFKQALVTSLIKKKPLCRN